MASSETYLRVLGQSCRFRPYTGKYDIEKTWILAWILAYSTQCQSVRFAVLPFLLKNYESVVHFSAIRFQGSLFLIYSNNLDMTNCANGTEHDPPSSLD